VTLSVVIPVLNGAAHLRRCLAALSASTVTPLEVIVADDGSSDGSAAVAEVAGARVVRLTDGPHGPASARNRGAAEASGDVLCFIDADTAVHADTLAILAHSLASDTRIAAVFGSYDARPDHPTAVSQYRNLLHHFVHQHGRREAVTFWAGCGAVRRRIFRELGGFDESYRRASIEDVEFGGRLHRAGCRIRLCPEAQVTHLKAWTLVEVVRSDVRDRATPWTQLILRERKMPLALNLDLGSRLSAVAAWVMLLSAIAGVGLVWPRWVAGLAATLVVGLNAPLYAFFLRLRGFRFALVASALHVCYLLYGSAVYAALSAAHRLAIVRRPDRDMASRSDGRIVG
jgi:glycosyltransferase involved in cell wall biosynthesis